MLFASFCFGNSCEPGTGWLPRAAGALRADSSRAKLLFGLVTFLLKSRAGLMVCRLAFIYD